MAAMLISGAREEPGKIFKRKLHGRYWEKTGRKI